MQHVSLAHWDTAAGISSSTVARDWWGQGADSVPAYDLLVVIPTHGKKDVVKRQAIRDSWAQYLNGSVNQGCSVCINKTSKLLFVVGTEGGLEDMNKEADEFKDMGVLKDFGQETYGLNNAEKTQRSIRYAVEHFKFRLLLKVDSDSWVFMDRLFQFLDRERLWGNENGTTLGIYGGHFYKPYEHDNWTDPTSNAFMALTGSHSLPQHAAGAGYILSPDLCEFIADNMGAPSEQVQDGKDGTKHGKGEENWAPHPRLASLPVEDAAIGFWLMAVNHTKVSLPVSSAKMDCETDSAAVSPTIIDHPVTTDEMLRRWRSYTKLGNPCTLEVDSPDRQKAQLKVTQWLRRHIDMPGAVARAAVQRIWQHKKQKA